MIRFTLSVGVCFVLASSVGHSELTKKAVFAKLKRIAQRAGVKNRTLFRFFAARRKIAGVNTDTETLFFDGASTVASKHLHPPSPSSPVGFLYAPSVGKLVWLSRDTKNTNTTYRVITARGWSQKSIRKSIGLSRKVARLVDKKARQLEATILGGDTPPLALIAQDGKTELKFDRQINQSEFERIFAETPLAPPPRTTVTVKGVKGEMLEVVGLFSASGHDVTCTKLDGARTALEHTALEHTSGSRFVVELRQQNGDLVFKKHFVSNGLVTPMKLSLPLTRGKNYLTVTSERYAPVFTPEREYVLEWDGS